MQYWTQAPDAVEAVTTLMRCPEFEQRVLRFESPDAGGCEDEHDEVLYVLDGNGIVTVGGERHDIAEGHALFVARGTAWSVDEADGLRILSVLVADPLPADATHAVIGTGERGFA